MLVFTPKDEYTGKVIDWGVKWIETPLEGTGANPIKDLKYLKQLHKFFKSEKPDVVLAFTIKSNIYSCLAGKFNNVPVFCNVSGLGTVFLVQGVAGKMALSLYKLAFRFSTHVFFQNHDDKKLFTSIIKIRDDKVSILPGSGIDLKRFTPTPYPKNETIKFVMVSRVIIEKGVREFAEAASYFADDNAIGFTLVGKFDEEHARSVQREELDQ